MYGIVQTFSLCEKGICHGWHDCFYIWSNWVTIRTCRMSVLVHCYSEFRCGKWPEERADNPFLGRRSTHHGLYCFNVVLGHKVLADGEGYQWKGDAQFCCIFIRNKPNFICPLFLFFVNAPSVNRLKARLFCESWASGRLTVWIKDCSVV